MVLDVVVMAAGKGTRMRSARPKVLQRLAGQSLLQHVLNAAAALGAERIVVITGHGADEVEAAFGSQAESLGLHFARQAPQRGTGHAVQQALPLLHDGGTTLVLSGDVPLIEPATLQGLVDASGGERLALLTVTLADATGYGRIVRDAKDPSLVSAIVEHKDASPDVLALSEVYTGVMAAPTAHLRRWLGALGNDNAAGEYYLTDVVAMAVHDGVTVVSAAATGPTEVMGVNSPTQLAELERLHQSKCATRLMDQGVRLTDPARFDVRGELVCGRDVEIDVNCIFDGMVTLGDGVTIGANCMLRNVNVAAGATIRPFTHIDGEAAGASVGVGAIVGPFARLRANARLGDSVHVGNFVEVKNATLGTGSKANHLAYLGDATVGANVNFGAGSITANYDGANKHRTTIGDGVHVGSNCVLIAPITLGEGATIGGGSTIGKDAPAGQLTVARAKQVTLAGWRRPAKK